MLTLALTWVSGLLECCLPLAEVAELADALRSGRSSRKGVWVRLPPSAPSKARAYMFGLFVCAILCTLIHRLQRSPKSLSRMTQRKFHPPDLTRKPGQFARIRILFAAILAIGLFLAIDFSGRITSTQPLIEAHERIEVEIDRLRREQEALIQQRDYVRSDAYVAQWARSEGRMALPGELLVIPVPSGVVVAAQPTPDPVAVNLAVAPVQSQDTWALWWQLFFDTPPPDFR